MKQIIKSLLGIVMIVLVLSSCNNGSTEKTGNTENTESEENTEINNNEIDALITHFSKNGFKGEKSGKSFEMIGAMGGVAYENDEFSIELYKFSDLKDIPDELTYRNGQYGMMIHRPAKDDEKNELIATFNSFK